MTTPPLTPSAKQAKLQEILGACCGKLSCLVQAVENAMPSLDIEGDIEAAGDALAFLDLAILCMKDVGREGMGLPDDLFYTTTKATHRRVIGALHDLSNAVHNLDESDLSKAAYIAEGIEDGIVEAVHFVKSYKPGDEEEVLDDDEEEDYEDEDYEDDDDEDESDYLEDSDLEDSSVEE